MTSITYQQPAVCWKEWIPLITQQQRLRNLIQIIGYNINSEKKHKEKGALYYYTLHLSTMCSPFYTSERIAKDNPAWAEVNFSSLYGNVSGVVIRVWKQLDETDTVITAWGIYFSGLSYIGPHLVASDCINFCSNTLIFHMHGGYFTSADYFKIDQPTIARIDSITVNRNDIRKSYTLDSLCRLHSAQRLLKDLTTEAQTLHDKIINGEFTVHRSSIIESSPFLRKLLNQSKQPKVICIQESIEIKKKIETSKFHMQLLQELKIRKMEEIQKLKNRRNELENENQEKGYCLMSQHHALSRNIQNEKQEKERVVKMKEKLVMLASQYMICQKRLISEMAYIYPIHKLPDGSYTICSVYLPNSENFEGKDEYKLSVALGFCVHLIQMISYIINVPLRYPVVHCGCRSKIVDNVTAKISDKEREFPLYMRSKHTLQFNYAVYLLNKDIAQLRWYCGLPTSDLRTTLQNLESFFQHCFLLNPKVAESVDRLNSIQLSKSFISLQQQIPSPMLTFRKRSSIRQSYSLDKGLDKWKSARSPTSPTNSVNQSRERVTCNKQLTVPNYEPPSNSCEEQNSSSPVFVNYNEGLKSSSIPELRIEHAQNPS